MRPQDWEKVKEAEVRGREKYEYLPMDEKESDKCDRCRSDDLIVVGTAKSGRRIAICNSCGENMVLEPVSGDDGMTKYEPGV